METLANLIRDLRNLRFEGDIIGTLTTNKKECQKEFFYLVRFELNYVLLKIIPLIRNDYTHLESILKRDDHCTLEIRQHEKNRVFLISCAYRDVGVNFFKFAIFKITKTNKSGEILSSWDVEGMYF